MEKKMGIYMIKNEKTGRVYIGSSADIDTRIKLHVDDLQRGVHHNFELQNDWSYSTGKNNFTFKKLEILRDEKKLLEREYYYIKKYGEIASVYNMANPFDNGYKERFPEIYKGQRIKGNKYKYGVKRIVGYLVDNHKEEAELLTYHANERVYYLKEDVDKWLIDNIQDRDMVDHRINGLLNKYYNAIGFAVAFSSILEKEIESLGKECPVNKWILISKSTHRELYHKRKERIKKEYSN